LPHSAGISGGGLTHWHSELQVDGRTCKSSDPKFPTVTVLHGTLRMLGILSESALKRKCGVRIVAVQSGPQSDVQLRRDFPPSFLCPPGRLFCLSSQQAAAAGQFRISCLSTSITDSTVFPFSLFAYLFVLPPSTTSHRSSLSGFFCPVL